MSGVAEIQVHSDIELLFEVTGHGWANLDFRVGSATLHIDGFSDIENSFEDFVFAGLGAACSTHRMTEFCLDGEPVHWVWSLTHLWRSDLGAYTHVHVEKYPDKPFWSALDSDQKMRRTVNDMPGEMLLDVFCDSNALAGAIRKAFAPFETSGLEEFEKRWGLYPFPVQSLAALETALKTPRRWVQTANRDPMAVVSKR